MVKRQLALGAAGGKLSGPAARKAALSERKPKHPGQCSGAAPDSILGSAPGIGSAR
jgi:hypothetical protein